MTKIYLTQGGTTILIPVPPSEISVQSNQKTNIYDGSIGGQFVHIGRRELTVYAWSAFFPGQPIDWALDQSMLGIEYVNAIQSMRDAREPIRLVVPHLGISADTAVGKFNWTQKKGKDIYYDIELTEHRSSI